MDPEKQPGHPPELDRRESSSSSPEIPPDLADFYNSLPAEARNWPDYIMNAEGRPENSPDLDRRESPSLKFEQPSGSDRLPPSLRSSALDRRVSSSSLQPGPSPGLGIITNSSPTGKPMRASFNSSPVGEQRRVGNTKHSTLSFDDPEVQTIIPDASKNWVTPAARLISSLSDFPVARPPDLREIADHPSSIFRESIWGSIPLQAISVPLLSETNGRIDMQLGFGSGQRRSPFSCSRKMFDEAVAKTFSVPILLRVKEKQSYFEHRFFGGDEPAHLEIAAATYEHDAFFCLLRYDIHTQHTRCVLFLKPSDRLKTARQDLDVESVRKYLDLHTPRDTEPLAVFNTILTLLQSRAHDFLRWRQQLYEIEARIGVSADLSILQQSNYSGVEYDYARLNADLTGVARNIADNELSVATILEHARAFLRVVDICERVRRNSRVTYVAGDSDSGVSVLQEEIHSTITRAEMYLKHTKMTQDVLTSLTAALYNRINKSDTRSMKTIAVVTLFFLPSMFVAAIFSTGIFNFQAGESPGEEKVISRYGWVYLMVTLLLTGLTLAVWTVWFVWGEIWLDKLRQSPEDPISSLRKAPVSKVRKDVNKEDSPGSNTRQPQRGIPPRFSA